MKKTALRSYSLALGVALIGSFVTPVNAQTITTATDPVGFVNLPIQGASDNVISLPMITDAVFSGTVSGGITANSFNVLAGQVTPGWTVSQFKYAPPAQDKTFYVEITSGQLKGLYYKIDDNAAASITIDSEGDSLLDHDFPAAPNQTLAVGDSFKIRSYFRVKDVLQVGNAPIIEASPDSDNIKDEVLFPNMVTVAQNKAPNLILHFNTAAGGWRRYPDDVTDWGNHILRPSEAFIVRRNNAAPAAITNLGGVLMNTAVTFVPGGDGVKGNDVYVSIARPAPVSLDASGLETLINPSTDIDNPGDQLLAFGSTPGLNRAPNSIYYYLQGGGWRKYPDGATNVGPTVMIEPGKAYIVRKPPTAPGKDWVNVRNF